MVNPVIDFQRACKAGGVKPQDAVKAGGLHPTNWWRWKSKTVSPNTKSLEKARRGLAKLLKAKDPPDDLNALQAEA